MPRTPIALRLLAILASGNLSTQTFIVDASNGPGTNFTSISAAITAVPDGAVLDVRAGLYAPCRSRKPDFAPGSA